MTVRGNEANLNDPLGEHLAKQNVSAGQFVAQFGASSADGQHGMPVSMGCSTSATSRSSPALAGLT